MNASFPATYFDGLTLQPHPVVAELADGVLRIAGLPSPVEYRFAEIRVSDRLARVPRFLHLPGGASLETDNHTALDAALADRPHQRGVAIIHWLEQREHIAAVAALLLVLSLAGTLFFGLPRLAQKAAMNVPAGIEQQAGRVALQTLDRYFRPTALNQEEQIRVFKQFQRLPVPGELQKVRLEFRVMHGQPNAFALPGGIIVVSDELAQLALSDEMAAVLAHEVAHLHYRHGLQNVLRSSSALLLISLVTGDLSTLTAYSATLPLTLLQRGYSRKFELEADAYAIELLKKAGIDPGHFSAILEKIEEATPKGNRAANYFSTHPETAERVKRIGPSKRPVATSATTPAETSTVSPASIEIPAHKFKLSTDKKYPTLEAFGPADKPPRSLSQIPPRYPFLMAEARINGEVVVEFIIDTQGTVRDTYIVRSSHREFEAPAVAAVMQWKFEPGEIDGKKVVVRASQLLQFNLEDAPANPP